MEINERLRRKYAASSEGRGARVRKKTDGVGVRKKRAILLVVAYRGDYYAACGNELADLPPPS